MDMIAMRMGQPVDPDIAGFCVTGRDVLLRREDLRQCQGSKLEFVEFERITAWGHDCFCFHFKDNPVVPVGDQRRGVNRMEPVC